ncbi:hypothetical protein B4589_013585 [Halolamina sp. CBA1230]|uniref:ApeA N-terminal domain 1-containing protein n=1 Tax=Halolamina sp. CBA1230 TaxID=1853690 RepID=UPI001179F256|nr:HEPN domain-containing protein [Halolamina sp. CBA1230]QKY21353.1 hypothetical protein B4589_013585 [Halolamina sp. CBA1230]
MEKLEYEGHWWLPGEHEDRVGGVLRFEPTEGAELELFEAFETGFMQDDRHDSHSRLYGVSKEGDFLTLVNSTRTGFGSTHGQNGEISHSSYHVQYIIEGEQIPKNNNISFTKFWVSFPGIKEWSQRYPISDTDYPPSGGFELELSNPDVLEADLMEYSLKLLSSYSPTHSRADTPKISSKTYFGLEPKYPSITLPRLRTYVSSLQDLLSIATNHTMEPTYIEARTPNSEFSKVNIYYSDTTFSQSGTPRITNINFRLPDIPDGFEGLVSRWFELRNEVKSTIDVFLGTRYSSKVYQQDIFLSLTQAVESYHRRRYDDEYMDSQDYESNVYPDIMEFVRGDLEEVYNDPAMFDGSPLSSAQLNRLKSMRDAYGFPNDLGNVLDSAVQYANEYSLRKRFKDLVNDEYHHILSDLPHSSVGKIHPIVETRNHFTHQIKDQEKSSAVAEGAELARLSWSVEQLLEVALLSELGVPESQIEQTLQDRYKQYRIY